MTIHLNQSFFKLGSKEDQVHIENWIIRTISEFLNKYLVKKPNPLTASTSQHIIWSLKLNKTKQNKTSEMSTVTMKSLCASQTFLSHLCLSWFAWHSDVRHIVLRMDYLIFWAPLMGRKDLNDARRLATGGTAADDFMDKIYKHIPPSRAAPISLRCTRKH